MRKVIVNTNCYHGYSIEEALTGISTAGFQYVELTATKGWTEHVFFDQSFMQLQHVKEMMEQLNLTALGFSGHTSLMDADRLEDFIMNIHLAHFFEAKYILTSVGEAHLSDAANTGHDVVVENLKRCIPYLEKYKMYLGLEVHGQDHGTGVIIKEIVDAVDSEYVKINYDTGNAIFYGEVDPIEDLSSVVDAVNYIHVKDKDGETKEWNFPALGAGQVDFKAMLEVLDTHQNDAPLSIEIEFTEAGAKDLDEVNAAVLESGKYLESLGLKL